MRAPTGTAMTAACARCGYNPAAIVTNRWEFTVTRKVHSANSYRVNSGSTRWAYKRDRDNWQSEFRLARVEQRILIAKGKRRVTLTRMYSGRERAFDHDNLAGGMKLVVDAMVREALLLDDRPEFAEIHYAQVKSEVTGLQVVIEDIG